jgi:hypothetical protein
MGVGKEIHGTVKVSAEGLMKDNCYQNITHLKSNEMI